MADSCKPGRLVAHLQTFEAIEPIDPFVVDSPVLPRQEDMNPPVAIAHPDGGNLFDPDRPPYQIRHTCAALGIPVGENSNWVAGKLGYKCPTVTLEKHSR
jgi:hypothetical protein